MDEFKHHRKDALLLDSKKLPAAGATATTDAIDIEAADGKAELALTVEALANLVAEKTVKLTLKECDTADGTFTAVAWAGVQTLTGKTGNGCDAFEQRIGIPSTAKKFVKLEASADTGAGDNTGAAFGLALLF